MSIHAQARSRVEDLVDQAAHSNWSEHRRGGFCAVIVVAGIGKRQFEQCVVVQSEFGRCQNVVRAVKQRAARTYARQQAVSDRAQITIARHMDQFHPGILPSADLHRTDYVG
ncbi:hypothetical protein D3C71_1469840 [compost metagenome]